MKAKILVFPVFLLISVAFISSAKADWQGPTTISEILVEGEADGSRIYIIFDSVPDTAGCTGATRFTRVYGNTEKGRLILSVAMDAELANKPVTVALGGCDDWNRPVIYGLSMRR
jgi:hypothetical protein